MFVSGVRQRGSLIYVGCSIFFQIPFPHRLLQNIEQTSLSYTVGSLLTIYFIHSSVNLLISTPYFSLPPPFHSGNHKFVCKVFESVSVLKASSFVSF